jgi:hypothetical protein
MKPRFLIWVISLRLLLSVALAQNSPEIETFQIRRAAAQGDRSERFRRVTTMPGLEPNVSVESGILLDTSALRSVRVVSQDGGSSFDLVVSFTDAGRAAFDAIWLESIRSDRRLAWIIDGVVVHTGYPKSEISGSTSEVNAHAFLTEADANRMADHIRQRLSYLARANSTR